MQATTSESTAMCPSMSPSDVELLNEAALFPVTQEKSMNILQSSDLRYDLDSPVVGRGTFSTCVKATKRGALQCVIKIPRFLDYDQFDRELTAMLRCNRRGNSHVVELLGVCMPPTGTVALPRFVMPLIDGVMLGRWLTDNPSDVRKAGASVASQLVDGVLYLHEVVGIIHGDLSMKNVLIDKTRNNHLTLIDLGSSRDVARGELWPWIHGHYCLSPPEALSDLSCDRILAETHVVGVLLICIERVHTDGLTACPVRFRDGEDTESVCAIARQVQFWGRSRLFRYWNMFRTKAGERIETIVGCSSMEITGKVGVAGLRLADPSIGSRQSLARTLRHLKNTR